MKNKISKGDTVVITDGSYAKSVIDGKLVHEYLNYGAEKGKKYVVIETGCAFPLENHSGGHTLQPEHYRNDVVIQGEGGKIVFIHHRFLHLVEIEYEVAVYVVIAEK